MNKRPRVSQEQQEVLLQFMMGHEDLARGRVVGADAACRNNILLQQLADALNAIGSGATKSPDKWWKCWQDWRSNTKAKAMKIKKYSAGTGGGPSPAPLTNLELTLVQFCGLEMVQGVQGVLDPLELTGQEVTEEAPFASVASTSTATVPDEVTPSAAVPEEAERQAGSGHKTKDDLLKTLARQAAALERLAVGVEAIGQNLAAAIQNGLMAVAAAIEKQPLQAFVVSTPEEEKS